MQDESTTHFPCVERTEGDLIGLGTRTPLGHDLSLLGRRVRVETNAPTVLEHIKRLGRISGRDDFHSPEFHWRIVSDPDALSQHPWPPALGLADGALRLVTFGQCAFLAVDFNTRQAVAYLADSLSREEAGFRDPFLVVLCRLTAEGLGLDPDAALGDLFGVTGEVLR